MPSTTLQARINAFEQNRPIDYLESPLSPTTAAALPPVDQPTKPPPSPSPSPPNLGRRTSLVDLKDWVVEDDLLHQNGVVDNGKTPTQSAFVSPEPLITLDSPPKPKPKPKPANLSAPPKLPPRKPSYTSIKSASSSSSPRSNGSSNPQPPPPQHPQQKASAFLYPPRSNVSLTVDTAHRYPPPSVMLDVHSRNSSNHAPSSSISSFHSVSLSSDTDPGTPGSITNFIATYPMDSTTSTSPSSTSLPPHDSDTVSLAESYEHVSPTASMISPATERIISADWEKALAKRKAAGGPIPPRLPDRPSNYSSNGTPTSSNRSSLKSPPSTPQPSHFITAAAAAAAASRGSGGGPGTASSVPSSTASSPILKPTHSGSSSSSPYVTTYQPRRAAPPPPPSRSSDRSSVQSFATTYSSYSSSSQHSHGTHTGTPIGGGGPAAAMQALANNKAKRPTPVPAAARKRYEAVFCANLIHRRKAEKAKEKEKNGKNKLLTPPSEASRNRRAAGWRGLSVDLITAEGLGSAAAADSSQDDDDDALVVDQTVGPNDTLEAGIVKVIWTRSGLPKTQLAEIWNECDPTSLGALTLDGFAKGMWRIDEELRRAQTSRLKSPSTSSLASYKSRSLRERSHAGAPPLPPPPPPRAQQARPQPDLLR